MRLSEPTPIHETPNIQTNRRCSQSGKASGALFSVRLSAILPRLARGHLSNVLAQAFARQSRQRL
jgi:hypothetical protein